MFTGEVVTMGFKGYMRRLRPKVLAVKFIGTGLLFLTLFLASTLFVLNVSPKEYPYNTYRGFPLSIYDRSYNIHINRTECSIYKTVIVIHSSVTNFNKRATIRRTWANKALLRQYGMKLVFFLGLPVSKGLQVLVEAESNEHKDIVQGNFIDAYTNITHKAVLWLRWVSENCQNVSTVLKLDDDVFVNLFTFHSELSMFNSPRRHIWCEVIPVGTQRIQRKVGLKWRVAEHELKGLTHYPLTLCRGYFVVLTKDSVKAMYEAAKETQFFWIDDYYVFGTLANRSGSMFSSLQFLAQENEAVSCFKSTTSVCPLIGVLLDSTSTMDTLWKYTIQQQNIRST